MPGRRRLDRPARHGQPGLGGTDRTDAGNSAGRPGRLNRPGHPNRPGTTGAGVADPGSVRADPGRHGRPESGRTRPGR